MRNEDLMVGDWFRFRYTIDGKEIVLTFCISQTADNLGYVWGNDGNRNGRMCEPERLEQIPLTQEILEKNGFRLTKADTVCPADRYWWAIDGTRDGAMVEIILYNPDVHGVKVLTKIHTQSSHESGVNAVHSCDIEYVHELQHALKLCRINKEIVL